MVRRAIVQVHIWTGLAIGLYVCAVSVTGAALVFRVDLQRALFPHLFAAGDGPLTDPVAVMESVSRAYPQHALSGVEAPTTRRPVYLAYVTRGTEFVTVLIDPVSARVLGELPEHAVVRTLQDLHFNLMAGRTGRLVNGAGGFVILILCATGLVIWWPGRKGWPRALVVDFGPGRQRLVWRLHRAMGIWSVAFIVLSAATGLAFVFPAGVRAVVNRVSAVTVTRPPQSAAPADGTARPLWSQMLDRARAYAPGLPVARVVLPFGDRGAFLVQFADRSPTPAGSELTSIYLDQYSGDRLAATAASRSWGDAVTASMTPLHVGGLGGRAGRWAWFLFGLAPAVLFITGSIAWWQRVVRPRLS